MRSIGRASVVIATLVALLLTAILPATIDARSSQAANPYKAGRYIVTFSDAPVAEYTGYQKGFAATQPKAGHKIDKNSVAVQRWQQHLISKQDAALAKVGANKIYSYTVTNNGVAVHLTARQANALAKTAGVVSLERDQLAHPDTTLSPSFLGLDAGGGLWSQLGGGPNAGAGLVIGVIDTGIWPENPSFAGNTGIPIPATWNGICQGGPQFPSSICNDKLIGARFYVDGFGKKNVASFDYMSPRDGAGHGSHTSSTAAGNYGVPITIDGKAQGNGSGMAPGAKLAMYKVCWDGAGVPDGCFNSDSVAAINDAILDGVDVLNYSIGGTTESSVFDSVEQAFRGANNANVFVANSAGNSGPGVSTLDHPSPWLMTVGAATFRRAFQAVELGNGARYVGASTTDPLPTLTSLVTAASVKLTSATTLDASRCFAGTLDPAKATGKIVVCDRGVNARIEKSFEVKRAGGVGMILANVSPNSLNGDYHYVPAVHVVQADGDAIKAYIASAGAGATAKIVPLTSRELRNAPQVPEITDFSSRGPSTTTGGDILKPDIAAPGNDVVAATAPPFAHGRLWDYMSGTSMSSPHIAGIGALLMARHPDWSPSMIRSAMVTSARDTVSSGGDWFTQGAGFVNPNSAANPGLVYPTSNNEYRQYLVGLGAVFAPPFDTLTPISGSELNAASIAIGGLPGTESVHRHVKNVGSSSATYKAKASVPGFSVSVSPSSLTLAPGAEATFTITFSRTTAAFNAYALGSLTWSDGSHNVRSPIALRPVQIAAAAEVHGTGASGTQSFQVTPGFSGNLGNTVSGLVGVVPHADSVTIGDFDFENPNSDADTDLYVITIPAGTRAARFSETADNAGDDIDLYVYEHGTSNLVDLSASASGDEQVTLIDPAAGQYDVYVNGFAGNGAYHISNFVVGTANITGTVTPNPASVTAGVPFTLNANWSGLDPNQRYFGVINYTGTDAFTLFSVN